MTIATRLRAAVSALAQQRIMVLGDVILDEYLIGTVARMSREAPIPVLEFSERRLIPGGAANPACNIVGLGGVAMQMGVIGGDPEGENLRDVMLARGLDVDALTVDATRPTTVKTRILAQMGLRFPQQMARLDRLSRDPISAETEQRLVDRFVAALPQISAVLFSDYRSGLLTPTLVARLREVAQSADLLLTADTQGELDKYVGFGVVKCNADDAQAYLMRTLASDADFAEAAQVLCARLQLTRAMMITRGADGITFATPDGTVTHCPAQEVSDVYDTVGAGDTAIAVITLALSVGLSLEDAATLANFASGLVVRRVGNYTPSMDELLATIDEWIGS